MKALLALMLVAGTAHAAPFLYADPYPPTDANQTQPTSIRFTINGGAAQDCQLVAVANNAKQPKCDLGTITAAGTYTLVMVASVAGGSDGSCVNAPNSSTCTQGGSASSAPFTYTLKTSSVSTPSHLLVAP